MTRVALACTLLVAALGGLATSAAADLPEPGPNGQIAFTSGRDDGTVPALDNTVSQIWLLNAPGGSATRFTSQIFQTSHHRHPNWSPDHTKITYARGPDDDNFNGPWSIIVHDVVLGSSVTIASASNVQDRPTWSPDGTRIAYQRDLDNADATANWVIETRPATGGSPTTVAMGVDTSVSSQFTRPHWTPDSQSILYGKLVGANDHDIYRAPADGGNTAGTPVVDGPTNDYQPAVSPAGDRFCFTRDTGDKDVLTATIGGVVSPTSLTPGAGPDYECAWSPDTTKILFTHGAFGAGVLKVTNSNGSGGEATAEDAPNPAFDGNGDWAVNFRPVCQSGSASVAFNSFVSIPLVCSDREGQSFDPDIVTPPAHGNLGGINNDQVIYTPNANFQGQDSFTFKNSDGNSDSNIATIAVTVAGPGQGPGPGPDVTAASITDVSVFPRRWRRGRRLPRFSAAVGTRIRWRLSEPARVTLTFQRARPGRRVGRLCLPPTRTLLTNPRCTRFTNAGRLSRPTAKAGLNTLRFQGRLTRRKRLALGVYRVVIGAVDAAGNRSKSRRSRTFRIVAR